MEKAVYEQFYGLEQQHWWFAGMRKVCRTLVTQLPLDAGDTPMRCLDLGSGTGLWTRELGAFGAAWGLDLAPEALSFSAKRGLRRLVRASVDDIPFRADSFRLITALGLIEHLADERRFLAELRRVCRPGGHVLVLTSAYQLLWSRHDELVHHKRRYTRTRLTRLMTTAGFEVIRSSYVNSVLLLPILAVRLIERLRGPRNAGEGSPDLFMPPPLVNHLLRGVLGLEARLLRFVRFPAGVGLVMLARKPAVERPRP